MIKRKGILLAGGTGTRLNPMTTVLSKHLLPVFDKPMIYHPLSTLMLMGIQDILLLSTPNDLPLYQRLLGTGASWGLNLSYCVQHEPAGIAQALILAEPFLAQDYPVLILGDNIFYGHNLHELHKKATEKAHGATIFAYCVHDPERYGVVEFSPTGKVLSLEEKPKQPRSNYAITGLYIYDQQAVEFAKTLKPSARGELEITDVNRLYLDQDSLYVALMGRGHAWLDTGTHQSLLEASVFVSTLQHRQGLKVACPEEIAFRQGWISAEQVASLAQPLLKNEYGQYLMRLLQEGPNL